MNAIAREGTWLYDGHVPTGVRVVHCDVRHGTGDPQDPPEIRDDFPVAGFDVQWASPTAPRIYAADASAVFLALDEAVAHAEGAAWVAGTLTWSDLDLPAQEDMLMAQDPRELQWHVLYGELATALGTFGRESAYGDGDFWLVDDDWGSWQHKVCVTHLAFVTSEFLDAVQHVLARFPDWKVLNQVDEKVGDIAASAGGFRVKADGITSSFG